MENRPDQSPSARAPSLEDVRFESIDIQPDIRIPSPKPSIWIRFWQPIGTTVMQTEVLKEPRGFMRCLQWFFAILAFATCANFSSQLEFSVTCRGEVQNRTAISVKIPYSYPFRLDHEDAVTVSCGKTKHDVFAPGDFSSDAQFFVFTGVISFLSTMGILVVYLFFGPIYADEGKKAPLWDFIFTVTIAVFWLSASAAWANGLSGLKNAGDPANWMYTSKDSPCERSTSGSFVNTDVVDCKPVYDGSFGGANVSVIFGFLNFFLWSANLWFIYKETSWFSSSSNLQAQQMPA